MRNVLPAALGALALVAVLLPPSCDAGFPDAGPVNLGCNTEANEDDPHVSADGRMLFYSSDAEGKYDVHWSVRRKAMGAWPKGKVYGDYVQTAAADRGAFHVALRDREYLYYATKKDKESDNFDIYAAWKLRDEGKVFSSPTGLNKVDTTDDELHPWLTPDGRKLYFSRRTGQGWRVFVATRQATSGADGFGEPVHLKDLLDGFHHPTLTGDGRTMYLQGPLPKGRWGLFVSKFDSGKWGKPEALSVNSPGAETGDVSPSLSRDLGSTWLYFASDRKGGKGKMDLWAIQRSQLKTVK